jgi:ABC-2 type transport system permease protein
MTALATIDKMMAIIRRDLLVASRYPAGLATSAIAAGVQLGAFYFLSQAIGSNFRPAGLEYFPFVLVGTAVFTFWLTSINSFIRVVQDAQQAGTVEVLMTSSTPAPVLVSLSAVSAFSGSGLQLLLYIGAGLLFFRARWHADVAACLAVLLLSVLIASGLGMLGAALQLHLHRGTAVLWLIGSGTWFLTGTLFPVDVLPKALQSAATLIPITHAVNAARAALLRGAGLADIKHEIGILCVFSCILLPVGLFAFRFALQRGRIDGTLSFY